MPKILEPSSITFLFSCLIYQSNWYIFEKTAMSFAIKIAKQMFFHTTLSSSKLPISTFVIIPPKPKVVYIFYSIVWSIFYNLIDTSKTYCHNSLNNFIVFSSYTTNKIIKTINVFRNFTTFFYCTSWILPWTYNTNSNNMWENQLLYERLSLQVAYCWKS